MPLYGQIDAQGRLMSLSNLSGVVDSPRMILIIGDPPAPGSIWNGSWVAPQPVAPTPEMVDAERDRRIDAGMTFQGLRYQTRPDDRENIAGAGSAAMGAMTMANVQPGNYRWHGGEADFQWIAENNTTHRMDAQTVYAFALAAMAHKQALIFHARAVKDMSPIPADYADNKYWS